MKAAEDGLEEFVVDLLEAGADPNSKHLVCTLFKTLIHIIFLHTTCYYLIILHCLFQKTSFSALHAAALSGSVECSRSILEAGANVDVLDEKNIHASHL